MTQPSKSALMRRVSRQPAFLRQDFLQSTSACALAIRAKTPALLRFAALGVMAGLAACGSEPRSGRAAVEIRGTDPNGTATASVPYEAGPYQQETSNQPQISADGGIVDHGSYQTAIARRGDMVSDVAARVGISASELAAYNGMTPAHELREGDELVLPPRPEGYGRTAVADAGQSYSAAPVESSGESSIDVAPLPGYSDPDPQEYAASETPAEAPDDGGWSPDLAAAAIERSTGLQEDGSLGAPPSSASPMPPEPPARRELESPNLARYQTGASNAVKTTPTAPASEPEPAPAPQPTSTASAAPSGLRLVRPVDGRVAAGFNKTSGPGRNDGVDFATTAGAPVKAAADGEVALVSKSLGGLGTIVLVRHQDDLLTVYGRVDNVNVQKGDQVSAGQSIGVVSAASAGEEPLMHFEVRRGAESLDPMQFLPG